MDQIYTFEYFLFMTVYGGLAFISLLACIYLLLRRANVFAPEITSPLRLRRWTAAFMASLTASHLWWLALYFSHPSGDYASNSVICIALDIVTSLPLFMGTMTVMLQDRRRSMWPAAGAVVLALIALYLAIDAGSNLSAGPILFFIAELLFIFVVMAREVRQYGRWLRENYADLEHKEVGLNFMLMAFFMLISIVYTSSVGHGIVFEICIELVDLALIFFLLWRVETLQELEEPVNESQEVHTLTEPIYTKIDTLIKEQCVNKHYYLNHDLSLSQLAKHIGTNTTYLSQYFSRQGVTYNTFINSLRIVYFIQLYNEAIAGNRIFTARQLASESGFRSYSTFSAAFKQSMGCTVTEWMHDQEKA